MAAIILVGLDRLGWTAPPTLFVKAILLKAFLDSPMPGRSGVEWFFYIMTDISDLRSQIAISDLRSHLTNLWFQISDRQLFFNTGSRLIQNSSPCQVLFHCRGRGWVWKAWNLFHITRH